MTDLPPFLLQETLPSQQLPREGAEGGLLQGKPEPRPTEEALRGFCAESPQPGAESKPFPPWVERDCGHLGSVLEIPQIL